MGDSSNSMQDASVRKLHLAAARTVCHAAVRGMQLACATSHAPGPANMLVIVGPNIICQPQR